jgi:hypothetical protein
MTPEHAFRTGKLLGHLQRVGIDAMPVRDDLGAYTEQLLLFFEDDKFVISVDSRSPTVMLKGVHDKTSR